MKYFDILGKKPSLFIKKEEKMVSVIGVIFSVILAILAVLSVIGFGIDLFLKEKPSLSVSKEFISYPVMSNESKIFAVFVHYPGAVPIPEDNRIFKISFEYGDYEANRDPVLLHYKVQMELCEKNEMFKSNLHNISSALLTDQKYYYCTPSNNFPKLSGKFGTPKFTIFTLYIEKCDNKTTNGNCKPISETAIDKDNLWVQLVYPDTFIDSYNYRNPVIPIYNSIISRISLTSERTENFVYKLVKYYSDSGIILSDPKMTETFQFDSIRSDIFYNKQPSYYYTAEFTMANYSDIYHRNYLKIQDIAAKAGGIMKFFIVVFTIALNFISDPQMAQYLLFNKLDKFQMEEEYQNNLIIYNKKENPIKIQNMNSSKVKIANSFFFSNMLNAKFAELNVPNKKMGAASIIFRCGSSNKRSFKVIKKFENFYRKKLSIENILKIYRNFKIIMNALFTKEGKQLSKKVQDYKIFKDILTDPDKKADFEEFNLNEITEMLMRTEELEEEDRRLLIKVFFSKI